VAQVDYSTWITKQDAARTIGVHTKQIERWAQEKKIQVRKWKRPTGGTPIVVCHPDDVERIAKDRNLTTETFVIPGLSPFSVTANNPPSQTLSVRPSSADQILDALAAAVKAREALTETSRYFTLTSETGLSLWLTLNEAVDYSGLPRAILVHMIETGELKARDVGAGRRGGRWRICKAVLEELR
jgi:hypothetical protein